MKAIGMMFLLAGLGNVASAALNVAAPEISPASGVGALTLLSGALLVIRGRRRK